MSATTSVNSTGSSNASDPSTTMPVLPNATLGEQDFLNLLVAQMTNQDPLNPISNTDFVAQMAQFNSLQQMQQIQTDLSQMNSQQNLLQASGLLGRQVVLQTDPQDTVTGVVSSMQIANGTPKIVVNGQAYDLSQLLSVSMAPSTSQLSGNN